MIAAFVCVAVLAFAFIAIMIGLHVVWGLHVALTALVKRLRR